MFIPTKFQNAQINAWNVFAGKVQFYASSRNCCTHTNVYRHDEIKKWTIFFILFDVFSYVTRNLYSVKNETILP